MKTFFKSLWFAFKIATALTFVLCALAVLKAPVFFGIAVITVAALAFLRISVIAAAVMGFFGHLLYTRFHKPKTDNLADICGKNGYVFQDETNAKGA